MLAYKAPVCQKTSGCVIINNKWDAQHSSIYRGGDIGGERGITPSNI